MAGYWIQLEEGFRDHPKIYRLANELSIPEAFARGLLVGLWLWSITNALTGELTAYSSRAIAKAADWEGNPEVFAQALVNCGWLEKQQDGQLILHGWVERMEQLVKTIEYKREQGRLRQQHLRERQKELLPMGNKGLLPMGNKSLRSPDKKLQETVCSVTRDKRVSNGITVPSKRTEEEEDIIILSETRAREDGENCENVNNGEILNNCENVRNDDNSYYGDNGDNEGSEVKEAVLRGDFKAIYRDVLGLEASPEEIEGCLRLRRMGASFELIEEAFMRAARYHAKTPFPFAAECLTRWRKEGITTVDGVAEGDYERDAMNGKHGSAAQKEAFARVHHRYNCKAGAAFMQRTADKSNTFSLKRFVQNS